MLEAFQLGPWVIEPSRNAIRNDQGEQRVPQKQIDLLCRLAQQPGQVVSRQQLLDDVWSRSLVNDEVLSRTVADLRAALHDHARKPIFIETVHGRGYRLLIEPSAVVLNAGTDSAGRKRGIWILGIIAAIALILALVVERLSTRHSPSISSVPMLFAEQLTALPGMELRASFSPDGQQIVFEHHYRNAIQLLSINNDDGTVNTVDIPHDNLRSPVWLDQSTLALLQMTSDHCRLVTFDFASRNLEVLADCWHEFPTQLAFDSERQRVYFTSDRGQIAFVEPGFSETSQSDGVLTAPASGRLDQFPRLSPDGTTLLFSRGDTTTSELHKLDLDSGAVEALTADGQLLEGHDWLTDASVIFSSDRLGRRALWKMNLNDKNIRFIGAPGAYRPLVSPDNQFLLYERAQFSADIYQIDLRVDPELVVPLIVSTRYDNHPAFSPDGSQIAFTSLRSGLSALWMSNRTGQRPTKLFENTTGRVSRPSWSMDGRRILVTIYNDQGSQLVDYDLATGSGRVLEQAGNHASDGIFLPDGSIAYLSASDTGSSLFRLHDSNASPIAGLLANRIQVSASGRLVFSRPDIDGLFETNSDGVTVRRLIPDVKSADWNKWAIAGETVYYTLQDGIYAYSLESGESQRLTSQRPTAIGISLSASADGSRLLLARTTNASADLMISETNNLIGN